MKTFRQAVETVGVAFAILCSLPAAAWYAVASGPSDQTHPAISGSRVAWTEEQNGTWDVLVRDVVTGVVTNVSNINPGYLNAFPHLPAISGDRVAWVEREPTMDTRYVVVVHDLASGVTKRISTSRVSDQYHAPALHGHRVAWTDNRGAWLDIYLYDLDADTEIRLTYGEASHRDPAIWENRVVFVRAVGAAQDIHLANLADGTSLPLTTNGTSIDPSIWGEKVVWSDTSKPDLAKDVILLDLPTMTTARITDNHSMPTFTRTSLYPKTDGSWVVWEQVNPIGKLDSDPYVYDIATGATKALTTNEWDQRGMAISAGRVVWTDYRAGPYPPQGDIYLCDPQDDPVANAGPDQSVHPPTNVALTGTGSFDPDGDYPLAYAWRFTAGPTGLMLSDPSSPSPTFSMDGPGDVVLELMVTDAAGRVSEPDYVKVSSTNTTPTADAGPDQRLPDVLPAVITLDGSKSFDPDGDPVTHQWSLRVPSGSTATLADPSAAVTTFTADVRGRYEAWLVVMDAWGGSADSVAVTPENLPPVADAGGNQVVLLGESVVLEGRSYDPDGDPITFAWSIAAMPPGSSAIIKGSDLPRAALLPDVVGQYVVMLVVCEKGTKIRCDKDGATIEVLGTQDYTTYELQQVVATLNALPLESLAQRGATNALTQRLMVASRMIDQGKYDLALEQLGSGILPRTDGCALGGKPDANDWIIDCASQAEVYAIVTETIRILKAGFR